MSKIFISTVFVLIVIVELFAGPALAFEGNYSGMDEGGLRSLTLKKTGKYYKGEFGTGGPRNAPCSGSVEGNSENRGNILIFKIWSKENPGDECIITVSPSKSGVIVKEEHGCMNYHGASCEFSGNLKRSATTQ